MTSSSSTPVLEVGGTHVAAAVVGGDGRLEQLGRLRVDSAGDHESVVATFVAAADQLDVGSGLTWGIAMPDPFDYERGIATFRDVGKYESIYGLDIGSLLRERVGSKPARTIFLNDADAFVLGEWAYGAARGRSRCVGVTLGTGLGTGWIVDGQVTTTEPGIPQLGRARFIEVDGTGLEEIVSTRGVVRTWREAGGDRDMSVQHIAECARNGDGRATDVVNRTFDALGRGLREPLIRFGAEIIVLGGSMARSWDLFETAFRGGLGWPDAPPVIVVPDPEAAALRGAAVATR